MRVIPSIVLAAAFAYACASAPELPSANESEWPVESLALDLQSTDGAPRILAQQAFGGRGEDTAYDIWPAPGGGFIVTGSTRDSGGNMDLALARLDDRGMPEWSKRFGGADIEIGFAVRTLRDRTILVAGWTRSFGNGAGDFYILGLDGAGRLEFEKTFGGTGEERATALIATDDGGALIVGESYSFGEGDARFYAVKIDDDGDLEWEKSYNRGPLNERGLAIVEADSGYLVAGNSMDSMSGSSAEVSDGYVVRIDNRGQELWSRSYGSDAHDIVHHIAPLSRDTFLLSGYTQGFGAQGGNDIWLVRIDARGNVLDQQVIGGPQADHNIVARQSPTGAVHLVGYTQSYGAGGWDIDLAELSDQGKMAWQHAYGGPADDGGTAVVAARDGSLAVTGYTAGSGGDRDMLFLLVGTAR